MKVLNKYKKIQILLLILIVMATIVFLISIYKSKNKNNYYETQETISETNDEIDTNHNELEEAFDIQDIQDLEEHIDENDTSWDEPVEENSEVDLKKEENSAKNNGATYYIKINYSANVVTIYKKDSNGEYTVPVKALICSSGKATPTSGVYKMSSKYRWHILNGGVRGQYCSRITGHILFHSVPYLRQSPDSLEYWAYDKLGTKASAGCIRLTVADAQWIYNNCESGTYVEFYSSSYPGPLGKPSSQKISSNEQCRNWDPTDPDPANPWRNYVEPVSTPIEETKKDNTNQTTNQDEIKLEDTPKQERKQEQNEKQDNNTTEPQENKKDNENVIENKEKDKPEKTSDNDNNKEVDNKEEKDEKEQTDSKTEQAKEI